MKRCYLSCSQKGVSLLETLFYVIVMASVIMASVAYFKSSTREQKLTNAVSLASDLLEVAAQYWESNLTFVGLTEKIAAESGLLPVAYVQVKQYKKNPVDKQRQVVIATPWTESYAGSSVTFERAGIGRINITFNHVPDYACQPLAQRLRTTGYAVGTDCQMTDLASKNIYNSSVSLLVQRRQ